MNIYLVIILAILAGEYLLGLLVETLNISHASPELPAEFKGWYDQEKYSRSQSYLRENTRFHLVKAGVSTAAVIVFILAGGFKYVDQISRHIFSSGEIRQGLIFAGILMLAAQLINLPFSAYHTFVIEARYGFNRTRPATFIMDLIKGLLLGALIGGTAFASVIWFFLRTGAAAWLWSWFALTLLQLFLLFISPVVLMPLFNKFTPLEEGGLKTAIDDYARKEGFRMQGVFTMDGSRRSTKSNAFFTGFGKYKRIALFDTLIQKHTVEELVAVLAHEMGHYKKKHILKMIGMSVLTSGIMLFLLSLFIRNQGLFDAFKMEKLSVYASLFFFGFLYTPLQMVFSVIGNIFSRGYEYEADAYAVTSYGRPEAMVDALRKLSVDNLSNLTPHPLKVFLEYSHPPVLQRIRAIRKLEKQGIADSV